MKKEHLLVIRFSALGDVAMTVPVVYALAQQYPDVRITVLSRNFARPLFDDLLPNINFMEADLKREYHGITGLNSLYRRLLAKQFTAIADLHSVLRSSYLRMRFNLDHYKVAHIDKHRKDRRRITSSSNKQLIQLPTSFQNYADVFARLGYPVNVQFRSIFSEDGGDMNLLPESLPRPTVGQPCIGIAPFAAHEGKIYPVRLMEQVVEQLLAKHPDTRIYLFGKGQREDETFPKWCAAHPQCVYVSQHLNNLRDELILMSHLQVMVSMDSANMHLASLVATPVVSVWGATHPFTGFMGWNQSPENAIQIPLECRPCSIYGQKPCLRGDYACMRNIAPEQIVNRVELILNKH
ncbi:glycosyl transferase family 1 [Prevotella sp. P5-126]|uniref:glycosyltransferase family 9 protein n=1 Tax=unclassified Prevotella TaxID=2638335 RepID=UPI000B96DBF2|nr:MULTISPECIES: glycosyltransferase family 9 protein [unclassified Prevotella]MCI7001107.1 glycosyltransferase family 9 protein [Prevotella sp.]MDD7171591.1 glycosyltransferase family 9 protein [Prevotella sp.]MDY4682722.1 glycosyltransferase family 9 protein [Prevotella sp.]OYP38749.1 glycosyl transferase family 1 [Prevotella sp. P5-126]OYP44787.1 glycosyl transferase family 1 [Prevotella sp. P4-98]